MELVIGKQKRKIDNRWMGRWQFLSDFQEEMGDVSIPWTYTPLASVDLWIALNRTMDEYDTDELAALRQETGIDIDGDSMGEYERYRQNEQETNAEKKRSEVTSTRLYHNPSDQSDKSAAPKRLFLLKLSELDAIISFMLPTSDRFLLLVMIDDGLSWKKSDYYKRLGEYIIKYGYSPNPDIFHTNGILAYLGSIHLILNVPELTLDRLHDEEKALVVRRIQAIVRSTPLIRFYGILRAFYQPNRGTQPGLLWEEVRALCMDEDSVAAHARGLEAVRSLSNTGKRDWLDSYIATSRMVMDSSPNFSTSPLSLLFLTKKSVGDHVPDVNLAGVPMIPGLGEWYVGMSGLNNEYHKYIIECADSQVDICEPEQLGWIAGIILGLGSSINTRSSAFTLYSNDSLSPIYALIYFRMKVFVSTYGYKTRPEVIDGLEHNYPRFCKTLGETMGTFYLYSCAKCLLRLVEYNDSTGSEVRVVTGTPRDSTLSYREERKNTVLLIEAIMNEIGNRELTLFTKWPMRTPSELGEELNRVKIEVQKLASKPVSKATSSKPVSKATSSKSKK